MQTKLFPIAIALCFASVAVRADVTPGNFWINPTFESGTDLNLATGTPDNWNRGGADGSILQVSTANSVSASHSLAIIKPVAGAYGEWYSDVPIAGFANAGDQLALHWHEIYNISSSDAGGAEMRLTVRFLDGGGGGPNSGDHHFVVTGNSSGWVGSLANSTFSVRNELSLPAVFADTVYLRIQLVSGGGDNTIGSYLIDDLSVSVVPEPASIAMLGMAGLIGLNAIRRRKMAC